MSLKQHSIGADRQTDQMALRATQLKTQLTRSQTVARIADRTASQ